MNIFRDRRNASRRDKNAGPHKFEMIPPPVSGNVYFRVAQSRGGKSDTVLLTEAEILPVPVDLARQNPFGIITLSRCKTLHNLP